MSENTTLETTVESEDDSATSESGETFFRTEGLSKRFGGLKAVDGMSVSIEPGTITALIGPNGAGKTTFFNLVTGVITPDSGTIEYQGTEIQEYPTHKIARNGLGRTFQSPRIFGGMSVLNNLMFAPKSQLGEAIYAPFFPGRMREEQAGIEEEAIEVAEFLDIDHLLDEFASGLSGGQRKLLELGQVLMLDPDFILLDEPLAGVNPALSDRILSRIHDLNEDGMTFLFIEHNIERVFKNSDYIVVMHKGEKLAEGKPEEIQNEETVIEAYLGGG